MGYRTPAGGRAEINWGDTIALKWDGDGPVPALQPSELIFRFHIGGTLTARIENAIDLSGADVLAKFIGNGGVALYWVGIGKDSRYPDDGPDGLIVSRDLYGKIILDTNDPKAFGYSLALDASTLAGVARADFGGTMELTSITFADGSTPESHGYNLIFDSGIQSPNLQAVPEPASLAIWSFGMIGTAILARRRSKKDSQRS